MKLNVTQSRMLAESIREEISKKLKKPNLENAEVLTQRLLSSTKEIFLEIEKKEKEIKQLADKADKILKNFGEKNNVYVNYYDVKRENSKSLIKSLAEKGIPTVDELHKKITLKALFSTEEDLQNFMSSIVKEYTNE